MKDGTKKIIRKKATNDEEQVQKRCSANSRERQRTQEINTAFNMLRRIIPSMPADKMSKIHTLRIATAYIAYLAEMLNGQSQSDFDPIDCNPQTSFHVWRSSKAQQHLTSSSITSLTLLDSKTFGRYSSASNCVTLYNNGASMNGSNNNDLYCKKEWMEHSIGGDINDEYSSPSTMISYSHAADARAFTNHQSEPHQPQLVESQRLVINHQKE